MKTYRTVPMWVVSVILEARAFDREDVPQLYNYYFNDEKDARDEYKRLTSHNVFGIAEILKQDDYQDRGGRAFTRLATQKGTIETIILNRERIAVAD